MALKINGFRLAFSLAGLDSNLCNELAIGHKPTLACYEATDRIKPIIQ